jgi:ABC-type lipoprotein export system ATPase subunit
MSSPTTDAAPVATSLVTCETVGVAYGQAEARVTALQDVDLTVNAGERLALWGQSGSGKTTLLHVLGGLVTPTEGSVRWRGQDLTALDTAARTRTRAEGIAYVFQGSNLLPHFSAYENVAFAVHATVNGQSTISPEDLLGMVGLADKLDALPAELSGGEAQRVALARALGQSPQLLLCDEPTGQLDSDTSERILDLIDAVQRERPFALAVATHDAEVAARYDQVISLSDGRLVDAELSR